MKPGPVHPQAQSWNWAQPAALVQFGQDDGVKVFGHCLAAVAAAKGQSRSCATSASANHQDGDA